MTTHKNMRTTSLDPWYHEEKNCLHGFPIRGLKTMKKDQVLKQGNLTRFLEVPMTKMIGTRNTQGIKMIHRWH